MTLPNIYTEFDSLGEFLTYIQDNKCPWGPNTRQSTKSEPDDWNGNLTFEGAVKLAQNGWSEGREKLSRELDGMKALTGVGSARAIEYDVSGYLPDVPRAISGLPDCMISRGSQEQKVKPIIRMLINIGMSCRITPKTIMLYGAAVLSYIDNLEENGYSVELSTFWLSVHDKHSTADTVILKQAGEPLEIDRMAFCLIHPSFFRRLQFRYLETFKETENYYAYGSPGECDRKLLDKGNFTVAFPKLDENFYSSKEAIKYVKDKIDQQLNPNENNKEEEE